MSAGRPDQSSERAHEAEEARLHRTVRLMAERLEAAKIGEYVQLLNRPSRLVYLNFVAGVARGLGFAVGTTLLAAIILYFLQRAMMLNIPVIGGFIAEVVRIVEGELSR